MTCTTYTGTYTVRFAPSPYTRADDLHAAPRSEREHPYTDTYTTYTRPDLHAGPPLFRGGPVVGMGGSRGRVQAICTLASPSRWTSTAADVRRQLVGMLSAQGMSNRAIAPTVGVSGQRVRQIVAEVASDLPPAEPEPLDEYRDTKTRWRYSLRDGIDPDALRFTRNVPPLSPALQEEGSEAPHGGLDISGEGAGAAPPRSALCRVCGQPLHVVPLLAGDDSCPTCEQA